MENEFVCGPLYFIVFVFFYTTNLKQDEFRRRFKFLKLGN